MPEPHSFPENIAVVRDRVRKIIGRVSVPSKMADVRSWPHNGLKSDIAPCPKSAKSGSRRLFDMLIAPELPGSSPDRGGQRREQRQRRYQKAQPQETPGANLDRLPAQRDQP
jgi:hypothetical protein